MIIGVNTWRAIDKAISKFRREGQYKDYRDAFQTHYDCVDVDNDNEKIVFGLTITGYYELTALEAVEYAEALTAISTLIYTLNTCNIIIDYGEEGIAKTDINTVVSLLVNAFNSGSTREIRHAIKELSMEDTL
jgi:hypothetical protein